MAFFSIYYPMMQGVMCNSEVAGLRSDLTETYQPRASSRFPYSFKN